MGGGDTELSTGLNREGTKDAAEASYKKGAISVLLLDGDAIVELMLERGIGVVRQPFYLYEISEDFFDFEKPDEYRSATPVVWSSAFRWRNALLQEEARRTTRARAREKPAVAVAACRPLQRKII